MGRDNQITVQSARRKWMLRVPAKLDPSGKLRREFFDDEKKANEERRRLISEISEHGRSAVTADERLLLSLARKDGLTPDQIIEAVRRFKDEPAAAEPVTLSKLADLFLEYHTDVKKSAVRHRETLKSRSTRFTKSYGARLADSIGPDLIAKYLDGISSDQTRQNHYLTLLGLFNFAAERGHVAHHPMRIAGRMVKRPSVSYHPPEIFSLEKGKAMLKDSSKAVRAMLALGCFAGIRSCEMVTDGRPRPILDWQDFDWKENTIHIRREVAKKMRKRDNERWVPISKTLQAWLKPLAAEKGPVIGIPRKELFKSRSALAQKYDFKKWPSNAPRHSFASYFLAAYPERGAAELAQIMGNSEQIARQHYVRALKKVDGLAWFAIKPKV